MKVSREVRHYALCFLGSVAFLGCHAVEGESNAASGIATNRPAMIYLLTATNTSVTQKIGPGITEPPRQKFVEIQLTSLANPAKEPLLFEVYFQPEHGNRTLLGTFSPYPADNPGKFIVPTSGRLQIGGSIILSMVLPNSTQSKSSLRVEVKQFTFRER